MKREEQETVICWNESDHLGILSTSSPKVMRRLEKAGYKYEWSNGQRSRYQVPKRLFRLPGKTKKTDPAQMAALRERGRELAARRQDARISSKTLTAT